MVDQDKKSRYKVGRLIEKYELTGMSDDLENRWTRSADRQGLRQLANYFNQQLLRAALTQNGAEPLEGEVENLYRLLTHEDVSSGVKAQTRTRLEQRGIDVDQLEEDFVSYQSIYAYLTKYGNVTPPDETSSEQEQREQRLNTVQRLKTRLSTVTERSLRELVNAGHLILGEFTVLVTVRVHCSDCDTRISITELISNGRCECPPDEQD